jgi:hypothetical protein
MGRERLQGSFLCMKIDCNFMHQVVMFLLVEMVGSKEKTQKQAGKRPNRRWAMATLQVRSMDDQLYEALGRMAAREQRSISQQVIAILKEHLSQPVRHTSATEDFLVLCSTWKDERTAEEIVQEIRGNRKSVHRFKETL